MTGVPAGTMLLAGREALDRVSARDYIDWAVNALSEGFDTPALRRLAGLDLEGTAVAEDARAEWRAACVELEIQAPSKQGAVKAYVANLAREIVEGRIGPVAGAERIHAEVLTPLNHPQDLMAWCFLWEGLSPDSYRELEGVALDEAILRTARSFVNEATAQQEVPPAEAREEDSQ